MDDHDNDGGAGPTGWARSVAGWFEATPAELTGLGVLLLGALAVTAVVWFGAPAHRPGVTDPGAPLPAGRELSGDDARAALDGTTPDPVHEPPTTAGEELVVHVSGAVTRPGVVRLPAGARVVDALTLVGGPLPGAEPTQLNLARPLTDGEHVHLPWPGEDVAPSADHAGGSGSVPAPADGIDADGRVDLNRADAAALESLPGIGPAKAAAIVAHREEHGPFTSPGQLREVTGIGERTFQQLAELVVVR